jgi:hypothetical protein
MQILPPLNGFDKPLIQDFFEAIAIPLDQKLLADTFNRDI